MGDLEPWSGVVVGTWKILGVQQLELFNIEFTTGSWINLLPVLSFNLKRCDSSQIRKIQQWKHQLLVV